MKNYKHLNEAKKPFWKRGYVWVIAMMVIIAFVVFSILFNYLSIETPQTQVIVPAVVNTWNFPNATSVAWNVLASGGTALDAVEQGVNVCELSPDLCGWSVGYGGKSNEDGEPTLDAMIMWGPTHAAGSVGCLKRVKKAISVARKVMEDTYHTLLVGEDASNFAFKVGFPNESLITNRSLSLWEQWADNGRVPNFWKIDPQQKPDTDENNHDTIGMVAIDKNGDLCAGTSTNGLSWKIAGRVGDSPIIGSGAYVDNAVGAAAATGDGDIMMRFSPSYRAVLNMANGMNPTEACKESLNYIASKYPTFSGALICLNKAGAYGGARGGSLGSFPFMVRNGQMSQEQLVVV